MTKLFRDLLTFNAAKRRISLNLNHAMKEVNLKWQKNIHLNLFCHFSISEICKNTVLMSICLIELCTILAFPFFLFLWKNIHPTSRSLGHWGPAKSHIVQEIEILSDNPTNYHMCFITFVFEMFHSGKFEFQSKLILQ